jgi:hypothetical protein
LAQRSRFGIALALLATLLAAPACSDPDNIGDGLLPGAEVLFTDAIPVELFTVRQDCVLTDDPALFVFGQLTDPHLGTATAGFYTQFVPATNGIVFPANTSLDSVVLQLRITGKYGNSGARHLMRVHRIAEPIQGSDREYYSIDSLAQMPDNLAEGVAVQMPSDTFSATYFRARLHDSFGQFLLAATEANMANAEAFVSYMPGLYVSSTCPDNPADGTIWVANMLTVESYIRLYYHVDADTAQKTVDYIVNLNAHGFNAYRRTAYAGLLVDTEPQRSPAQQEALILQGGNNTRIVGMIDPATLATLGIVAINRAELVLSLHPSLGGTTDDFYPEVNGAYLYARAEGTDREDSTSFRIDLTSGFNTTARQLTVDLTAYVQDLITSRRPNTGFVATVPLRNITFQRAIFAGNALADPTYRPRLRIHYSRLPE